jgi:RNA polymerase subunit RPABC4/transcription elongation factor Spt4
MLTGIDIVATRLGAARPAAVLDHNTQKTAFHAYPSSRFGFPLTAAQYKETEANPYCAFYAATIARFPGRNPTAMLFGIVAGRDETLIYDRFGLAAHLTAGRSKVNRTKTRVTASHGEIRAALSGSTLTPLAAVSGKTVTCPACGAQPVRLKSFLNNWNRSGRRFMQMLLCDTCLSMVTGREWLGSIVCRNCGTRVSENSEKCIFCGEYPLPAL